MRNYQRSSDNFKVYIEDKCKAFTCFQNRKTISQNYNFLSVLFFIFILFSLNGCSSFYKSSTSNIIYPPISNKTLKALFCGKISSKGDTNFSSGNGKIQLNKKKYNFSFYSSFNLHPFSNKKDILKNNKINLFEMYLDFSFHEEESFIINSYAKASGTLVENIVNIEKIEDRKNAIQFFKKFAIFLQLLNKNQLFNSNKFVIKDNQKFSYKSDYFQVNGVILNLKIKKIEILYKYNISSKVGYRLILQYHTCI